MRILLDENLSRRFRRMLPSHDVSTVAYQNLRGIKNGALLALAEQNGFQIFLTADQNLHHQQNLSSRRLAVVVLSTNKFRAHRARIVLASLPLSWRLRIAFPVP